jgi:DNA-binding NtrC family response regulator
MKPDHPRLLLIQDNSLERRQTKASFGRRAQVECAASGEEAFARLAAASWDAVIADVTMQQPDPTAMIGRIREAHSELPIIAITASHALPRALAAMRAGATQYLIKPIDAETILELLRNGAARPRPSEPTGPNLAIAGSNPRLEEVRQFGRRIAAVSFARVLITGESGTGKSLLAQTIHDLSAAPGRFMVVNCAALPSNLLESELFGHERGAFTDARTRKYGLIELAHEGTLFLDEIGAMPLDLQAKLLLFLENHEVRRLGGTQSQSVRVRVIAATNEDLRARVRERTFRADLLYRLDVASIELPPLRLMPDVLPQLVALFTSELAVQFGRPVPDITSDTFAGVAHYSWPGNVRELRNVVERSLIFHESGPLILRPPPVPVTAEIGCTIPYGLSLHEVERRYIAEMIKAHPGADYVQLAAQLKISRKTLWEKRRRYNL